MRLPYPIFIKAITVLSALAGSYYLGTKTKPSPIKLPQQPLPQNVRALYEFCYLLHKFHIKPKAFTEQTLKVTHRLTPNDVVLLFKLIKSYNIRALTLREAALDMPGIQALAQAIRLDQRLNALTLSYVRLDNAKLDLLAPALAMHPKLQTLDLTLNEIGDKGAAAVATIIRKNKHLRSIRLSDNQITDSGALAIKTALMAHKAPPSVILSANPLKDAQLFDHPQIS